MKIKTLIKKKHLEEGRERYEEKKGDGRELMKRKEENR